MILFTGSETMMAYSVLEMLWCSSKRHYTAEHSTTTPYWATGALNSGYLFPGQINDKLPALARTNDRETG